VSSNIFDFGTLTTSISFLLWALSPEIKGPEREVEAHIHPVPTFRMEWSYTFTTTGSCTGSFHAQKKEKKKI
jgi:hypothetical protein